MPIPVIGQDVSPFVPGANRCSRPQPLLNMQVMGRSMAVSLGKLKLEGKKQPLNFCKPEAVQGYQAHESANAGGVDGLGLCSSSLERRLTGVEHSLPARHRYACR